MEHFRIAVAQAPQEGRYHAALGRALAQSDERAAALGIALVLEKPVDTARLSEALRRVLDRGAAA